LFWKPLAWATVGAFGTIPPGNQWVEKNGLEFKDAQRVLVDSNTIQNTWTSGQEGYGMLFTVKTSQSGNLAVVDDITVTNNLLTNVEAGFTTLYHDYECGDPTYPNCTNPGEARRISVINNLVLLSDHTQPGMSQLHAKGLTLADDMTDFVYQHNTTVPFGTQLCDWSVYFNYNTSLGFPPAVSRTNNVWLIDSILCTQPEGYGLNGTNYKGADTLAYYMGAPPDPAPPPPPQESTRFFGNVMWNSSGQPTWTWPPNNYISTTGPTYVSPSTCNYTLLSPNWTDTTDGTLSGVNMATLPQCPP